MQFKMGQRGDDRIIEVIRVSGFNPVFFRFRYKDNYHDCVFSYPEDDMRYTNEVTFKLNIRIPELKPVHGSIVSTFVRIRAHIIVSDTPFGKTSTVGLGVRYVKNGREQLALASNASPLMSREQEPEQEPEQ